MKQVVAVAPHIRTGIINFKLEAYNAWKDSGGKVVTPNYPRIKPLVGWFHNHELPSLGIKSPDEARLRFIEPINRYFDAFPDYVRYEIIPFIWDCWPCLDNRLYVWLRKHNVQTAIFTSGQAAERIQKRCIDMNILVVTEGVNTNHYKKGCNLRERNVDLIEIGRSNRCVYNPESLKNIKQVCTSSFEKRLTDDELFDFMADSKITITLPKCDTDASIGNGQETLTQRYWEAMLSRCVMIGHAPKELVDLIGYNPCIEIEGFISHRGKSEYIIEHLDDQKINEQIIHILSNINEYQSLVDKNREVALEMSPWTIRMRQVQKWLISLGYKI